jgi:hypothetical protein
MAQNLRVEEKTLNASQGDRSQLASIKEEVPAKGLQAWLNKDFWIGRTIWVSLGVERASLTGLAMSVDGYRAAKVTRAGDLLVLTRDSSGLFGGTVLAPDMPLNAYPIVKETETEILVDLASPKTPYGLTLSNFNAGTYSDTELAPRFEYVRSLETTANSLSFVSVTTTKSPQPLFSDEDGTAEAASGQDPYLLSLTLRTDWILPIENEGFTRKAADENTLGFFLTPKRIINNGTATEELVQKIATNKPFVWEISANTPAEYRPAIEQAILAWNPSLGGDVLKVNYAEKTDSVTKPNVSNLIWDDNMAVGFAFANWRSSPTTGEIVQAQVYMSGSMWAQGARMTFQLRDIERQIREAGAQRHGGGVASPQRAETIAALKKARTQLRALQKETAKQLAQTKGFNKRLFLGLNSGLAAERARSNEFCFRPINVFQDIATAATGIDAELDKALRDLEQATTPRRQEDIVTSEHEFPTHMPYPTAGMDAETFSKYVVRAVVMHEVGHTLGLRHNFMGSLGTSKGGEIQSASIMDYNDEVIDAQFSEPGSYDQAIVASEYQDKPIVEQLKFCTDEHAGAGIPTCSPFDFSANPIRGQHVSEETNLTMAQLFLQYGQADVAIALIQRGLSTNIQKIRHMLFSADIAKQFLQDPAFGESQKEAWKMLTQSMAMQDLGYPAELQQAYKELLISYTAMLTTPESAASAIAPELVNFNKEVLVDSDGSYSLGVRRYAILGLQNIQAPAGRLALSQTLELLNAKLAQGTASESTAEDEEVVLLVEKILKRDGYYK